MVWGTPIIRNTHVPSPIINHAPEIMKYQKPYPPVNIAMANPPLMTFPNHSVPGFP